VTSRGNVAYRRFDRSIKGDSPYLAVSRQEHVWRDDAHLQSKARVYGFCETCGEDIEWHIAQSHAAVAAIRRAMRRTPISGSASVTKHKSWQIEPQSCQSNGAGWCPKALVRLSEDGLPHMQIVPDRMFNTKQDADAYAVKMAKELIDDHVKRWPKNDPRRSASRRIIPTP